MACGGCRVTVAVSLCRPRWPIGRTCVDERVTGLAARDGGKTDPNKIDAQVRAIKSRWTTLVRILVPPDR